MNAHGIIGDIQSLLNKLTLENFTSIYQQLLRRAPQTIKEYRDTVFLVYDKAVMEPHFSSMYAKLCRKMNHDYPAKIEKIIRFEKANGKFVCCEIGSNEALFEPMQTEAEAKENAMKMLSVRRMLAEKCQTVGV